MKKLRKLIVFPIVSIILLSLCACDRYENQVPVEPQTYTIQYTDDTGVHTLSVKSGDLYSIETIPQKTGYDFLGLYDAEVGGTQFINAGGSSLSEFSYNRNLVLYPQFQAKEYTLILDYQGAAVTGERSVKVNYGEEIFALPINVVKENKDFVGWFTQPEMKGTQVADMYGVIPENRKFTEKIFDLSDPDGNVKLFAGFKSEEYTVSFYVKDSGLPEEVKVEYGTPISEVQIETRVDGKAVISWSKKRNDTAKEQLFTGKVTGDMVLYAAEFAPVIDFDSNGGSKINSLIARAGDAVTLPAPVRENYKFIGWQDGSGNIYNSEVMPTDSIKLTAKWQAMIMFDTNGGSDVDDISVAAGEVIELPIPEKDGFIFAGWYTDKKEKYTSEIMPAAGISLKAGWYAEKETLIIFISGDNDLRFDRRDTSTSMYESLILDLSQYLPADFNGVVKLDAQFKARYEGASLSNVETIELCFYSTSTVSDSFKLWGQRFSINSSSYADFSYSFSAKLTGNKLYGAISSVSRFYGDGYYLSDYRINLTYPDTTNLNL